MAKGPGFMFQKLYKNRSGFAMVLALVVLLVITLSCMTILFAASSNLKNTAREKDRQQATILADSLLYEVIEPEIEIEQSDGDLELDLPAGVTSGSFGEYLYSNIVWKSNDTKVSSWRYYDEDSLFYTKAKSMRSFDLTTEEMKEIGIKKAELSAYWTSSAELEKAGNYDARELCLSVKVTYQGKSGTLEAVSEETFGVQNRQNPESTVVAYYWTKKE